MVFHGLVPFPGAKKIKKRIFFFFIDQPSQPEPDRVEFGVQVNIANPGAQQLVVNFTSEVDRL